MKLAHTLLALPLLSLAAGAGCALSPSDNDGGGDEGGGDLNLTDAQLGSMLVEILEADDDDLTNLGRGLSETPTGNDMLHGTCETKASESRFDIRYSFSMGMVPTSQLKLDHDWLTNCGPVGDAHVFCGPTGQPAAFGDYVTIVGFSLGADPNLGEPNTRTQIGLTMKSDGGTPWEPLPQYMCDSWGGMTNFLSVNAETGADGIPSGYATYSMPDGVGGIMSQPAQATVVWQNGSVIGVINSNESNYHGYRVNLDRGPIGNFEFAVWGGGDVEPPPNGGEECRSILTY